MSRRALIASSTASIEAAAPVDVIYTDHWEVLRATGAEDVRTLFGDESERVDAAVAEWADWLTALETPSWRRVPLAPSLRADLVWSILCPVARHAIAGYRLAEEGYETVIDIPAGTPAGDAVIAGVRAAGGKVEQVGGGVQPTLPDSHRPVSPEVGASLGRYRAFRAAAPLISMPSRMRNEGRPTIALAYYSNLEGVLDRLADRAQVALWPWALPPPRKAVEVVAGGGICLDPATPADVTDLAEANEAFAGEVESAPFDCSGIDLSALMSAHLGARAGELMKYALYRSAAALESLSKTRPSAVVVPYDVGLAAAPLVLAAKRLDIPTLLIQHGSEASMLPGDKLIASDLLLWSEFIADRYPNARAVGPAMLDGLAGRSDPEGGLLLLSYPVRHNIARDSWMVSEAYLKLLADAVGRVPMEVVGLKIHPSESPEHYQRVMREVGLKIPLLAEGTVPDHLERAAVVAGPESTGLLEGWAAGATPICINLSGTAMSPPFDGMTEIPVVGSGDELVMALKRWGAGEWTMPPSPPRLEAVVGRPEGSLDATVAAIMELAGG